MADNVAITAGSGTTVATDDIGGVHHQLVKIEFGVADSATMVSSSNPLPVTVSNANANGSATSANSAPVVIASDQAAVRVKNGQAEYETVAASATAQVIGATGATGDYVSHVTIIPATTSPGAVTLLDNATSITIFTGGASSVSNLVPFTVVLGANSVSGAWKLTTGANVSAIVFGDFT